jgi:hypothetical protein
MDLFVNGTSLASGVGTGGEKFKGFGDGDTTSSWVHFLANKLSCNRLWNHSFPSKPMSLTMADTIGFCEQYYDKHGTYENLFVIVEWLMPQAHGQWAPVQSHLSQYQNYTLLPIVISWPDKPNVYESIYVCKSTGINYLGNKAIYDTISRDHITEESMILHARQRDNYYHREYNMSKRLYQASLEIEATKQWLNNRGIHYVMFWVVGFGQATISGNRHLFARSQRKLYQRDPKFIPINEFTGSDSTVKSQNPVRGHPDYLGHVYITNFLYDYVLNHQLLPTTTLIHI